MKFGVEFASRSVSRWRNYNIDYNLLKSLIREATSGFEDASSSDNSATSLTEQQKKLLRTLYKNFKDQIDFASLFVFSKVGEISRRLSTLKKQCNLFIKSETEFRPDNKQPVSSVSLRLRKRKLLLFHKELDSITNELQDLSRFILLQKIAVKKLLKKFIKYSSYPQKQSFVDKITTKFLIENPKSFIHLSLDDLALETTLLYDFLDTFLSSCNSTAEQKRHRQASIHTIDSIQLITQSYSINDAQTGNAGKDHSNNTSAATTNSDNQLFPRSTTFDIVSIRKGPRSLKFWIHKDNLDEIKFLLSSEFKLITDDSLFTKDRGLKNTRSSLNLHEDVQENKNDPSFSRPCKSSGDEFCPETETLSIWLNNPSHPLFVQTAPLNSIDYDVGCTDNLHLFKANPYSQILISNVSPNDNNTNNPILVTPIGGLRQFSIASLNKNLVDILFNEEGHGDSMSSNDEKKKLFVEEWSKADLKGNKQMMQLSLNWVIDNNVKPLARISSKKLRYINLDKFEKINFYISLEWDIQVHQTNDDGTESSDVDIFPHAILTINFDVPESEFPASIASLIDSHLVYRVDNFNFSINNYLISLYIKNHKSAQISDEEMLLFIAPWHNILTDKDIRILPEVRAKSIPFDRQDRNDASNLDNALDTTSEANGGILLNKNDIAPSKPGYWNEFDNGSDFGGDDDGFYVYTDPENDNNFGLIDWFIKLFTGRPNSESDDLESNYAGASLDWLAQDKTNKILHWADNTRDFGSMLKKKLLGSHTDTYQDGGVDENRPLARRTTRGLSFGAISDAYSADEEEEEESDSETEAMLRLSNKKKFGALGLIERENHDKCLSFLYMVMVVFSLFTSSIGTFILSTIFGKSQLPKPQMTAGLLILVIFAIVCLLLSIILSGFSICLLMCRYIPAPTWHLSVVWLGTLVATTFFFYGILTCF